MASSKRKLTRKGKRKASMKQHKTNMYTVRIPDSWSIKDFTDEMPPDSECSGNSFVFAPENEDFTLKIIGRRFKYEIKQTDIWHMAYTHLAPKEPIIEERWGDFIGFAVYYPSYELYNRNWTLAYKDILLVVHYESKRGDDCSSPERINQIQQVLQSLRREELT